MSAMRDASPRPWVALAVDGPIVQLSARLGPRLQVAGDGGAFVAALRTSRPSLAILAAPPATSAEERDALDVRAVDRDLRLVHLTRACDIGRRLAAMRSGFDEALVDDVDPGELLARLTLLDERRDVRALTPLAVADEVVLDPVAHQVRRGEVPIHLRPREYDLLAALAAAPGRAWTRRELLDQVWGRDHVGDPRTVDVHVRWLRSKIEPVPASPVHLVTVRGVGYRFDPPAGERGFVRRSLTKP
jgi:DNA-binding response OmpR family regulator